MKNHRRIKLIAASIALMTSFSAVAGLGGLNVQSNLGEPFSGTVTVTGEEAKILLNGGQVTLSDNSLRSSVRKSGDNAVVSIRSSRPVQDPVLIFQLGVGSQARQYTAMIDPPGYAGNRNQPSQADRQAAARERVAAVVAGSGSNTSSERPAAVRQTERRAAPPAARQQARPAAPLQSGQYTVRSGENLSAIASRVRPSGLSTYQTVQALILANPELFREQSADKLWPGNVLNIPSAAELRRLAQGGAEAAPSASVETPAAASGPAATPAEPAVTVPASEPAATAAEQEASAVVAPASEPAVAVEASEPAVVPVPQPSETTAAPADTDEGESSGLWRWLLLGGLGLIALWILSKLLGKKQKTIVLKDGGDEYYAGPTASPFEDKPAGKADTDIRVEQPVARPSKTTPLTRAEAAATMGAAAAATAAAKKATPADEELEIEDDFDDDIFFTEVSDAPAAHDSNINLDLGSIDQQQSGILSGAVTRDSETEQRKTADWDKIESTDSVYEPEPEHTYTPVSVEIPEAAPAEEPVAERDFTPFDFEAPTEANIGSAKPLVIETPAEPAAEPQTEADKAWFKEISQDAGIEMQDGEDFIIETESPAAGTETIEWEDLSVADDDSRDGAGFISESVGMTAPLEAKYELAKMYVEIGDPEAAKETLLELLEESDGGILARAKAMLAELER